MAVLPAVYNAAAVDAQTANTQVNPAINGLKSKQVVTVVLEVEGITTSAAAIVTALRSLAGPVTVQANRYVGNNTLHLHVGPQ